MLNESLQPTPVGAGRPRPLTSYQACFIPTGPGATESAGHSARQIQSGRGQPHSKTWRNFFVRPEMRSFLEWRS